MTPTAATSDMPSLVGIAFCLMLLPFNRPSGTRPPLLVLNTQLSANRLAEVVPQDKISMIRRQNVPQYE